MRNFLRVGSFGSAFILAGILFLQGAVPVFALSMSPPVLEIPSVLRGTSQHTSVHIGRMGGETGDLYISVSARGEGSSSLVFDPSFIIPADSNGIDFPFTIDASHAADGSYRTEMLFMLKAATAPGVSPGVSVSVVTGVTVVVRFSVSGDQVISYQLNSLTTRDAESDSHPFITFDIANTGNVDWKPQKVVLTFADQADATHNISFPLSGDVFKIIPPNQQTQQLIEVPQLLPEGQYIISADIFDKDVVIGTLVSSSFSVLSPGSLSQSGQLLSVSVPKNVFSLGEKIPLNAEFKNTGDVPITVVLMTEIYEGDKYIDLIRGDDTVLSVGEDVHLTQVFDVKNKGKYTLISYAKYSNKKTQTLSTSIEVNSGNAILDFLNSPLGLSLVVGMIIFSVSLFLWKRRRAHRAVAQSPVLPPVLLAQGSMITSQQDSIIPPSPLKDISSKDVELKRAINKV